MSLTKAQIICPYCHEDVDGCVEPLEKNCHAYVTNDTNYCPNCGAKMEEGD